MLSLYSCVFLLLGSLTILSPYTALPVARKLEDSINTVSQVLSRRSPVAFTSRFDAVWNTNGNRVNYQSTIDANHNKRTTVATNTTKSVNNTTVSIQNNTQSTTTPFVFTLNCNTDASACVKARRAFESAGKRIAEVLQITHTINVLAKFNSFCLMGKCDDETLGRAGAASFWAMDNENGQDILYPQALAKQVSPTDLNWSQYDIIADFNADTPANAKVTKFWFQDDAPIVENQYDFEYVVLHELIHGLGFLSSWSVQFKDPNSKTDGDLPMLTPPLSPSSASATATATGKRAPLFSPLLVFDRYIVNLSNKTESFKNAAAALATATDSVMHSQDTPAYEIANNLYEKSITPVTLGFSLDDSEDDYAVLDTRYTPFCPGSSLSHLDLKLYDKTPDALLRSRAANGKSLAMLGDFNGEWQGGPLGPLTARILERLGYSLKINTTTKTQPSHWQDYVNQEAMMSSGGTMSSLTLLYSNSCYIYSVIAVVLSLFLII